MSWLMGCLARFISQKLNKFLFQIVFDINYTALNPYTFKISTNFFYLKKKKKVNK